MERQKLMLGALWFFFQRTVEILSAGCRVSLPAARRDFLQRSGLWLQQLLGWKIPQGHGEGEDDHSPCSGVQIWECSYLRNPLVFFSFCLSLIPWWSPELRFMMSLFILFLSAVLEPSPYFITPKKRAVVSAVWQEVAVKRGPVMWKGSESLWPSALFHFWTVNLFFLD